MIALRRPARRHMVAACLAALLAGCDGETHLEDLREPLLWWEDVSGFCSSFVAIDGQRTVWLDHGCEAPIDFDKRGKVSAETQDAINRRFDELPSTKRSPSVSDCHGRLHTFGRRRDHQSTTWVVCGAQSTPDPLEGLQEPYLGLARQFTEVH